MSKFEIDTDQIESLTTVLARILEAQDLNEIEITQGETTIRIVREGPKFKPWCAITPRKFLYRSPPRPKQIPSNSPTHSPRIPQQTRSYGIQAVLSHPW